MENIFVCLAAPLLIAVLLLKGEAKRFIGFYGLGSLICLLAFYINGYVAALLSNNGEASLTASQAIVQVTPICEEAMKALPVFLYVAAWEPESRDVKAVSLAIGLGFASFENICYIIQYGAEDFPFMMIRGFSAGVMHAVCAAILGSGLALIYRHSRLAVPGAFALLCASSTYHAVYNLLTTEGGVWRAVGYLLPLGTAVVIAYFFLWRDSDASAEQ